MKSHRTRPDARIDYRHFPAAYAELVDRLGTDPNLTLGPMTAAAAAAARRDLYRYKMFLSRAAEARDDHAAELFVTLNNTTIRLTETEAGHYLAFSPNSISAAMEALSPGAAPSLPPADPPDPVPASISPDLLYGTDDGNTC